MLADGIPNGLTHLTLAFASSVTRSYEYSTEAHTDLVSDAEHEKKFREPIGRVIWKHRVMQWDSNFEAELYNRTAQTEV